MGEIADSDEDPDVVARAWMAEMIVLSGFCLIKRKRAVRKQSLRNNFV